MAGLNLLCHLYHSYTRLTYRPLSFTYLSLLSHLPLSLLTFLILYHLRLTYLSVLTSLLLTSHLSPLSHLPLSLTSHLSHSPLTSLLLTSRLPITYLSPSLSLSLPPLLIFSSLTPRWCYRCTVVTAHVRTPLQPDWCQGSLPLHLHHTFIPDSCRYNLVGCFFFLELSPRLTQFDYDVQFFIQTTDGRFSHTALCSFICHLQVEQLKCKCSSHQTSAKVEVKEWSN